MLFVSDSINSIRDCGDLSLMMALVLALCLLTPPLCDCWRLAPANCDFICCLSGLTLPLPLCVPPEEARLQRSVMIIYTEPGLSEVLSVLPFAFEKLTSCGFLLQK